MKIIFVIACVLVALSAGILFVHFVTDNTVSIVEGVVQSRTADIGSQQPGQIKGYGDMELTVLMDTGENISILAKLKEQVKPGDKVFCINRIMRFNDKDVFGYGGFRFKCSKRWLSW